MLFLCELGPQYCEREANIKIFYRSQSKQLHLTFISVATDGCQKYSSFIFSLYRFHINLHFSKHYLDVISYPILIKKNLPLNTEYYTA